MATEVPLICILSYLHLALLLLVCLKEVFLIDGFYH